MKTNKRVTFSKVHEFPSELQEGRIYFSDQGVLKIPYNGEIITIPLVQDCSLEDGVLTITRKGITISVNVIPEGGTEGQILIYNDGKASWIDPADVIDHFELSESDFASINGESVLGNKDIITPDTKVTSADNHYTPITSEVLEADSSVSSSYEDSYINRVSIDSKGHITSIGSKKMPNKPDYWTDIIVTNDLAHSNAETSGTEDTYIAVHDMEDENSVRKTTVRKIKIVGDGGIKVSSTNGGELHISAQEALNNLDASKITSGTISIDRLPAGALERMFIVDNEAAALNVEVQEGDVVQVTGNSNKMYFCISNTATTFASKFREFTAGTATSVPWSGVTDKPNTLSGYNISDAYTKTEVNSLLGNKANSSDLNNYVTLDSNQTISAIKTFTLNAANPIVIKRTTNPGGAFIDYYANNSTNFWRVGMTADNDFGYAYGTVLTNFKIDSSGNSYATKFIKVGGTNSQFLKADGSVDSNSYALSSSLANYLPITGGTLTGVLKLESMSDRSLYVNGNSGSDWNLISFSDDGEKYFGYNRGIDCFYFSNPVRVGGSQNIVWHAGNDGHNSGLDADTLDGVHNGYVTAIKFSLTDITDLDNPNSIDNGITLNRFPHTALNKPETADNANCVLNVFSGRYGTSYLYGGQLAVVNNGRLYWRTWNSAGTHEWKKLAYTSDISSVNLSNYLPLTGGTISNSSDVPLVINSTSTNNQSVIKFSLNDVNKGWIGYSSSTGVSLYTYSGTHYLNIKEDGVAQVDGNTIWHSGNDGPSSGLDADTLDGYHNYQFAKTVPDIVINQYKQGSWMRFLDFDITSGTNSASISFSMYPYELNRNRWVDCQITIRNNEIIFFANVKGLECPTLKCVGNGTKFYVWMACNSTTYDGYSVVIHKENFSISRFNYRVAYSDTTPTDTYNVTATISGVATKAIDTFTYDGNDAMMKMYAMASNDSANNSPETVAIQTCFDRQDPQTSSYTANYSSRCLLALQPRGGYVAIGKGTASYKLDVEGGIRASSNIFVGTNTVLHTGNYTTTLDDRYLTLSGGTLTGILNLKSDSTGGIKCDSALIRYTYGNWIMSSNSIRFGDSTSWGFDYWAGLKYNFSTRTIYLGAPDKEQTDNVFDSYANTTRSIINLKHGVDDVYLQNLHLDGSIYIGTDSFIPSRRLVVVAAANWSTTVNAGNMYNSTTARTISSVSGFSEANPDSVIISTQKLTFTASNVIQMVNISSISGTYYIYCLSYMANGKVAVNCAGYN